MGSSSKSLALDKDIDLRRYRQQHRGPGAALRRGSWTRRGASSSGSDQFRARVTPVPVWLLGVLSKVTVSLEPNPETPFFIDLPGPSIQGRRITVPEDRCEEPSGGLVVPGTAGRGRGLRPFGATTSSRRACVASVVAGCVRRVLIAKLSALGDVLRTTSLLRPQARRHPGARVAWLTSRQALPLLETNPWISDLVTVEAGGSRPGFRPGAEPEEDARGRAAGLRPAGRASGCSPGMGSSPTRPRAPFYYDLSLLNRSPDGVPGPTRSRRPTA